MITRTLNRKYITFGMALVLLAMTVQAQNEVGHLTVTGMVKVNGKPAATGDIVGSGSTVETAAKSSAVVSLGKLGRVEVRAETKMQLSYNDSSITVVVESGHVRCSPGRGVTARGCSNN